jgi:putative cell wall-binding protein
VLSRGDAFPDALCAVPLAHKYNAPILLADSDNTKYASEYIEENNSANIIVFGGTGAIGEDVLDKLIKK